jgi:hypothetical protein
MNTCLTAILESPYWNLINFIFAAFAVTVSIGYFLKPRLFFIGFIHDNKWKVRVTNKNLLLAVKEVQCEIAVSEHQCFKTEKTLPLKKDKTLVLRKFRKTEDDYVFRTIDNVEKIQEDHRKRTEAKADERDYKYLRIRILALNFMGIRKYYERFYELKALKKCKPGEPKPKPISYRQHKKCQKKMFENLKCNENA